MRGFDNLASSETSGSVVSLNAGSGYVEAVAKEDPVWSGVNIEGGKLGHVRKLPVQAIGCMSTDPASGPR